jgi:hypothetical protein
MNPLEQGKTMAHFQTKTEVHHCHYSNQYIRGIIFFVSGLNVDFITRCDLLTLSFDVTEFVIFQQYFGNL